MLGSTLNTKKLTSKQLQKNWANPPRQSDLQNDLDSAESSMSEYRTKLQEWELTLKGGPEIEVVGIGKSTVRPLVTKKNAEWKYPALEDPILSTSNLFRVEPATSMDTKAAEQNARVLNYQWNTKVQKTKLVSDIVRTVVDEGTVIVKTGWEYDTAIKEIEEEVPVYASPEESLMLMQQAVQSGQMSPEQAQAMLETGEPVQVGTKLEKVEREVTIKNQPSYEVCITANVTIDPTCDGVASDALFVIHEYDTSYADLKSDEYTKDEDGEEYGVYHNLDFIVDQEDSNEYDEFAPEESNNFEFKDKARKRLRAYEYWGYWDIQGNGELVGIVATWVGKTLIRLEENPFPHGRLPFSIATYMPVKKSVHGEPDAELLKENQDAIGKMTRAIHDITAKQAVGQEFIDENFFPSPSQKNSYEKGNTVFYRSGFDPKKAIHRQDVQQVGSTPFDIIQWQTADANELTGTRPFGGPGGAKLNGSKDDKNSMDATAKREASILRRLSELLFVDMARMTIAMNQEFLDEETVIRITDKEFIPVKRDDLQGDFDLRVQISTPEADNDKATKIMKLLQTNAATMSEDIVKMHYVELATLWKLEGLAARVEESQPDPMQQELMAIKVENAKLQNALLMKQLEDYDSKIIDRLGREQENREADIVMKQAKAEMNLAAARKIDEESDILSQSFVAIQTGEKRQQEIEDMEYKASVESAKEEQKTMAQAGLDHMKNSYARTPGKVLAEI